VCCDQACNAPCFSCLAQKNGVNNGTCAPTKDDLEDASCPLDSPSECKADGKCDGKGKCRTVMPEGAKCGADDCSNASVVSKACDGFGNCGNVVKKNCVQYKCDPLTKDCRTSCQSQDDCAAGNVCHLKAKECVVEVGHCAGNAVVLPDGSEKSCGAYQCVEGSGCLTSCNASKDCAEGFVCEGGKCASAGGSAGAAGTGGNGGTESGGSGGVGAAGGSPGGSGGAGGTPAASAEGSEDSGCGCAVPGRSRGQKGAWFGVALGLVAWRRRRAA
jgi:hypothetical protein